MTDDDSRIYIHAKNFLEATKSLTMEQVGRLVGDIIELHEKGLLKDGPILRVTPPITEGGK